MQNLLNELNLNNISVQSINDEAFAKLNIYADVLRLDKIHPVISGNKWFKLKYWLQQAALNNHKTIATFGGAFSNHIIAVAYACNKQNINCVGFIRGEEPETYSQTLRDAKALNMQLIFLSRQEYKHKQTIMQNNPDTFFIPEGGFGKPGANGASEILQFVPDFSSYNYIICAVGTGTMLAGIANASLTHQCCIGVSVLKNNISIGNEINFMLTDESKHHVKIIHDYHFGGYAKYTNQLIKFMNDVWQNHHLPLDFVYTAKAMYAVYDLVEKNYFKPNSKVLIIHSGGLQGNSSLNNIIFNKNSTEFINHHSPQ